jgi:hypothetical protein
VNAERIDVDGAVERGIERNGVYHCGQF